MRGGYDFYLRDCLLPIAPEKLTLKISNENDTIKLINEGEVNILKDPGLTEIEFECVIPQVRYPFAVYKSGFLGAAFFLEFFEKLKTEKKPFQFIVSRAMPNGGALFSTNMKVAMEDYKITEQAKDGFDIKVTIKLKQYREHGMKIVSIKPAGIGAKATAKIVRAASTVRDEKPVVIGSEVIVNGRLHGSSYGDAPGQTRTNYRGKINFINLKGSHPYHVTTPQGGWLGWVSKESVKVV